MPLPGCVAQDGSTYCILVLVQVVTCTSMYCSIEVPTLQRQHPKSWATTGSGNWIQGINHSRMRRSVTHAGRESLLRLHMAKVFVASAREYSILGRSLSL